MTLHRVPLIKALTRQATVIGLTYNYFAVMLIVCFPFTIITEWYFVSFILTVGLYIGGRWLAENDPQWIDGFFIQNKNCRLQKNRKYWGCRSYAPW